MHIHLIIFISSLNKPDVSKAMTKTYESDIRPVKGDIIDDPGFHPEFHNGYEVAKVTLNYAVDACWVSLSPLAIEVENIEVRSYIDHLEAHGWQELPKEKIV
ncbi:hypothetical protein ACGTN9_12990 [Halobacillus sp. MO56]